MTSLWADRITIAAGPTEVARTRSPGDLVKRLIDVTVALTALPLVLPLLLVLAVAVRLDSPGPALFRQERVGRRGRTFVMLKFRTMATGCDDTLHRDYVRRLLAGDAEQTDGLYKLEADPRLTRVGGMLRRTSLDELPQLLNVLRGEMSLVGPRPAMAYEVAQFPAWAMARFLVRPGLTGLWQVSGRNRVTMTEGLRLDVQYVAQRSLLVDLRILLRTIPAVFAHEAR